MAFALTAAKMYEVESRNPGTQGVQVLDLTVTRGTADVALDLSNPTGTFWTAVQADATFGQLGKNAISAIRPSLTAGFGGLISLEVLATNALMTRSAGAPAAATEYRVQNGLTFPAFSPSITLFAGVVPATVRIIATFIVNDGFQTASL